MEFFLPLGSYVNCFHFLGCETERDTQNVLTLCCWQAEKLLCFIVGREAPGSPPAHSFSLPKH